MLASLLLFLLTSLQTLHVQCLVKEPLCCGNYYCRRRLQTSEEEYRRRLQLVDCICENNNQYTYNGACWNTCPAGTSPSSHLWICIPSPVSSPTHAPFAEPCNAGYYSLNGLVISPYASKSSLAVSVNCNICAAG
jgi:hypothetical protein